MTPILFHPTLLQGLTGVAAILLPLLVGLVTTRVTSANVKAVLLLTLTLILSLVTAWIAALQTETPFDLWGALYSAGGLFIVAVASHFGLWKPTSVSNALQEAFTSNGAHVITSVPEATVGAIVTEAAPTSSTVYNFHNVTDPVALLQTLTAPAAVTPAETAAPAADPATPASAVEAVTPTVPAAEPASAPLDLTAAPGASAGQ